MAEADEMYTESARLKTFKNWPFGEKFPCSAARMAEAGFYHCPTDEEKDLVQCFVCFKELDGWESIDDPWQEHRTHSESCPFAKIGKRENNLTIAEIFDIENERHCNKIKKITAAKIQLLRAAAEGVEEFAYDTFEQMKK